MKLNDVKSSATVIYALTLFTLLILNVFFGIRPIASYIHFLERSHLFFLIPLSLLLPIGLFLFDKLRYKNLMERKANQFNSAFKVVQDLLKDSNAKTQLLINDMKDANINENLLKQADEILKKSNFLVNFLPNLEP